jgi:hypothetical protein
MVPRAQAPGLVILLALFSMVIAQTTLVCDTRAGAAAYAAAACVHDTGCTFAMDTLPTAALLDDELGLIQDAAGPFRPDARAYFLKPAWRTSPLVTYAVGAAADAGMVAADPCTLAAATIDTTPLPFALFVVLDVLSRHALLVGDSSQCPGPTETPLRDPVTGLFTCKCAPGKVCAAASTDPDTPIFWIIGGLVIVLVAGAVIYVLVTSTLALRRAARLRRLLGSSSSHEVPLLAVPDSGRV